MSAQKLNTLHLHLSDDEAFRLEVPEYPSLSKFTAYRYFGSFIGASNFLDLTTLPNQSGFENPAVKYGGFYSAHDISELIKLANANNITIIPEIEMPGHARSIKKAYPKYFFDFDLIANYSSVQGYNDNVLPIYKYGKDRDFSERINQLIRNVANLFANQTTLYANNYEISLAGDEVPQNAYGKNTNSEDISHSFFRQIGENLDQYKISGYQQLVQNSDGNIPNNALKPNVNTHIWAWIPTTQDGIAMTQKLLNSNYPVVANFADYLYLDTANNPQFNEPGLYWATDYIDSARVLQLGALLKTLSPTQNLQGVEASLWSELIPNDTQLWYMLLPRLCALSEIGWSNAPDISWKSLANRLGDGKNGFLAYLANTYGVSYRGYPDGIKAESP